MDTRNENADHDADDKLEEHQHQTAELETFIYENNFHEIGTTIIASSYHLLTDNDYY